MENNKEFQLALLMGQAPSEIPDWFSQRNRPSLPDPPDHSDKRIQNEADREHIKYWLTDGCYDLPPHLMWFQLEFSKVQKERIMVAERENEFLYFKWREYFGISLLKMGERYYSASY